MINLVAKNLNFYSNFYDALTPNRARLPRYTFRHFYFRYPIQNSVFLSCNASAHDGRFSWPIKFWNSIVFRLCSYCFGFTSKCYLKSIAYVNTLRESGTPCDTAKNDDKGSCYKNKLACRNKTVKRNIKWCRLLEMQTMKQCLRKFKFKDNLVGYQTRFGPKIIILTRLANLVTFTLLRKIRSKKHNRPLPKFQF